jgi:CHASE3 domain sensor protein
MKLSIGKKLGLGFGTVVIIMVLAGGFSLYQLNKSAAAFRNVSEHEMTAALAVFGIRANFDEMAWATKNILLRGKNREILSKEIEIFNDKKNRLETLWKPMFEPILKGPDCTDAQRKLYDDFQKEYASFLAAWDKALPVYKSQGRDAADAIMSGKGRKAGEPLTEIVRSLREKALKDMEKATARTRTATIIILIAFVVAVVIAVITTISLARYLKTVIEGTATNSHQRKGKR